MSPLENLHLDIPQTNKKRVIIIGGGFAGIQIAKGVITITLFSRYSTK
jgi:NADH dehydrogenase